MTATKPLGGLPERAPDEWGLSIHVGEDPTTDDYELALERVLLDVASACYSGDRMRFAEALGGLLKFAGHAGLVTDMVDDLVEAGEELAMVANGPQDAGYVERVKTARLKQAARYLALLGLLGVAP